MTIGSLFSGIGGFDLAASRVWGWDCVRWQVEIDPWAQRVLAKHWPNVPRFGDIRELTGEELEPVELICGGFPCQPFSDAGRRRAQEDTRHLWPEMLRLVSALRPAWVVGENVPPLIRLGLDEVAGEMEDLGYAVEALCIPACAVGAPHIRERLWIVGRHTDSDPQSQIGAVSARGQSDTQSGRACASGMREAWHHVRSLDWTTEPGVGRVADGIPRRLDRLRGLGNAIVPQVAEVLFRLIDEAEA